MSPFDVTSRRISPTGAWEEWVERVEALDEPDALSKVLRRRGTAMWLLDRSFRFRFGVAAAGLADTDELVCEEHPELPWPHGDCAGPGMLREDVNEQ